MAWSCQTERRGALVWSSIIVALLAQVKHTPSQG
jgi:hypothetical protein